VLPELPRSRLGRETSPPRLVEQVEDHVRVLPVLGGQDSPERFRLGSRHAQGSRAAATPLGLVVEHHIQPGIQRRGDLALDQAEKRLVHGDASLARPQQGVLKDLQADGVAAP